MVHQKYQSRRQPISCARFGRYDRMDDADIGDRHPAANLPARLGPVANAISFGTWPIDLFLCTENNGS